MQYFQTKCDDEIFMLEMDENRVCKRQIIYTTKKRYIPSNVNDPEIGFSLPDQILENMENFHSISKAKFEFIWRKVNKDNRKSFKLLENKYRLGQITRCFFNCNYPQGTIFSDNNGTVFIINYDELVMNINKEHIYPGLEISGQVVGYDRTNYWIIISNPKEVFFQKLN